MTKINYYFGLVIGIVSLTLVSCQQKPINQLFDELTYEKDFHQSEEIAKSIAKRGEEAVPFLIDKMHSSNQDIRFAAADVLVLMHKYHPDAVQDLMSIIDNNNTNGIAKNYPFYIRMGINGTEQIILKALDSNFSEDMCVDYINCGNHIIETGASDIASKRGYSIYQTPGSHSGPKWGEDN